jgi:hypothetical protein
MTIQTLIDSINNLTESDFNQGPHKVSVFLDPEKQTIYSFVDLGGVPESYFHNIDQFVFEVKEGVIFNSVKQSLLGITDDLEAILNCFQGIEWDGNNNVGTWDEAIFEAAKTDFRDDVELQYYTDPNEWYVDQNDMLHSYRAGATPEEYMNACETENDDQAVNKKSALEWLEKRWEQFKEDEN